MYNFTEDHFHNVCYYLNLANLEWVKLLKKNTCKDLYEWGILVHGTCLLIQRYGVGECYDVLGKNVGLMIVE